MSAKNRDEHNRFRNITVGFRVSPEENKQINEVVAVSGLSKQEYCYRRCMSREITVLPNTRVFKGLKDTMNSLTSELQRISSVSVTVSRLNTPQVTFLISHPAMYEAFMAYADNITSRYKQDKLTTKRLLERYL